MASMASRAVWGDGAVMHEAGHREDELADVRVAAGPCCAEAEEDGAGLRVGHEGGADGADASRVFAMFDGVGIADRRACAGASAATHGGLLVVGWWLLVTRRS